MRVRVLAVPRANLKAQTSPRRVRLGARPPPAAGRGNATGEVALPNGRIFAPKKSSFYRGSPMVTCGRTCMRQMLTWFWTRRLGLAGCAMVLAFLVLAGRFWHPYYGFTKFLQIDEADARVAIPELRAAPVYFYSGQNGYDASAYSQIAFHPGLDSPDLKTAVGNVPYRARRILGSALALLVAGGNPDRIANAYATLNLAVWLGLAAVLWRLLPVRDWRGWLAWVGVLFSAGALHAVRLALTDLLGLTLFAAAMLAQENRRERPALGLLALAGLARETALAGVVAFWRGPWLAPRTWIGNAVRTWIVIAPLGLWIAYIRWQAGPADQGFGNFSWPGAGFVEKWFFALAGFRLDPAYGWLNAATLLATLGLTVQAGFLVSRRLFNDAWWRVGAVGVVMMLLFGTSVWEGHPGAATRVLLPMGLAFAVLAVRQRATWLWLVAGSLSVWSGVLALWTVPQDAAEIAAGRSEHGAYVLRINEGWYGCERDRRNTWAWTAREGQLVLDTSPRGGSPARVRLSLRALAPRTVEIRHGARLLWSGPVGVNLQSIEFPVERAGRVVLQLRSSETPVRESSAPGARALGFAVYNPRVE